MIGNWHVGVLAPPTFVARVMTRQPSGIWA